MNLDSNAPGSSTQELSQKTKRLSKSHNNNNGEKSDSDDCSSSYSEFYCKSSVSAPAESMRNCSSSSYATMANRLRSAMPIAIDGPLTEKDVSQKSLSSKFFLIINQIPF